jgi:hypothetical protein
VGLTSAIRTVDTAATALWLLGLEADDEIVGRPVTEAFASYAQRAAAPRSEDAPARAPAAARHGSPPYRRERASV